MKYIDADKLIAEIERRKADAKLYDMSGGDAPICDELLSIVTSLQQEQSFPHWIHANYSDKPEIRYTPSGTPYLQNGSYMIWLSDLDTLPKDGKDLTNPIQEQPEGLHFTPLNRLIQIIPSKNWNETVNNYAKKLRDCLIKEGYLKDAEVLQGYISYMNGNNVPMATMDKQEQPEMDFEKEIGHWMDKLDDRYCILVEDYSIQDIKDTARHFYELGLNARK